MLQNPEPILVVFQHCDVLYHSELVQYDILIPNQHYDQLLHLVLGMYSHLEKYNLLHISVHHMLLLLSL